MTQPKLRFRREDGTEYPEWENDVIENIFEKITDYVAAGSFAELAKRVVYYSEPDYAQLIRTIDVKNSFRNKDFVYVSKEAYEYLWRVNLDNGTYVILPNIGANIGEAYLLEPSILPYHRNALAPNAILLGTSKSIEFYFQYFITQDFQNKLSLIVGASGQPKFNKTDLKKIEVISPCLEEQQKIAIFLSTVDEVISRSEAEVQNLEQQKKAAMQKIFSQEVRFRREDGTEFPEWRIKKLSAISSRVVRKNKGNVSDIPLTIASLYGLVDQREYFNKTIASQNMEGYYLLKNGEFAYNKSYSKGYDFGAIKRLDKYECGALSTLYICFVLKNSVDSDFMVHYFDSQKWNKEVSIRCAEGARNHGLLNIATDDFFNIEILLPEALEEQQKIADFLSAFDDAISCAKQELDKWKELKKGLLQQMFV